MRFLLWVLSFTFVVHSPAHADSCLANKPIAIRDQLEAELNKVIARDYPGIGAELPRSLSTPRLKLRGVLKLMKSDILSIHIALPNTLPEMVLPFGKNWMKASYHPKVAEWKEKVLGNHRWMIITFKDRSVLMVSITEWQSALLENTTLVQDTVQSPVITIVQAVQNGEWVASTDTLPVLSNYYRADRVDAYIDAIDSDHELQSLTGMEVRDGICIVRNESIYTYRQAPSVRFPIGGAAATR